MIVGTTHGERFTMQHPARTQHRTTPSSSGRSATALVLGSCLAVGVPAAAAASTQSPGPDDAPAAQDFTDETFGAAHLGEGGGTIPAGFEDMRIYLETEEDFTGEQLDIWVYPAQMPADVEGTWTGSASAEDGRLETTISPSDVALDETNTLAVTTDEGELVGWTYGNAVEYEAPADPIDPLGPTGDDLTSETQHQISLGEGGTGPLPVETDLLVYTALGSYVDEGTSAELWLVPESEPNSPVHIGETQGVEHWYEDIHSSEQDYTSRIVLPIQVPGSVADGSYSLAATTADEVFGWIDVTVDSTLEVPGQTPNTQYPGDSEPTSSPTPSETATNETATGEEEEQPDAAQTPATETAADTEGFSGWAAALIAAAGVLVLGGVVYFILRSRRRKA